MANLDLQVSRSSLEPLILLDKVTAQLFCFRDSVHCCVVCSIVFRFRVRCCVVCSIVFPANHVRRCESFVATQILTLKNSNFENRDSNHEMAKPNSVTIKNRNSVIVKQNNGISKLNFYPHTLQRLYGMSSY